MFPHGCALLNRIETIPVTVSQLLAVQETQESVQVGPPVVQQPLQVDESRDTIAPRPLHTAVSEISVLQDTPEATKSEEPVVTQPLGATFLGPRAVEQPLEVVIPEDPAVQQAQEGERSRPFVVLPNVEVAQSNSLVHLQSRKFYRSITTTTPILKVYAFPLREQDFHPNWIRLVTRSGDVDTAAAFLLGFIKLFCRDDYYKVLQGSAEDGLWLEALKIDSLNLSNVMSGSEPVATMDDVFVLIGVMLCNVNSKEGTSYDWFRNRVDDLVPLFPLVSEPPPVPLYSGPLAEALSTLRKLWPCTIAQIVRTIVEGSFKGPMRRLQGYVCAQWRTAKKRRAEPELLESVPSELPMPQEAEETTPPWNPLSSAQQESPMPNTPVAKKPRQEPDSTLQ
ncbi:hypothetical protein HPB51_027153 [Rhipicephalus microplus]|uniref:Uncharacterized protein n=1 Tax=Rhipicephalus microplus TaxID=6941 RepID=A0A9J6D123_RHIMP|nr:hypothetical protein HPB51_027153 [Rhipicephalus microplus]